MSDHFVGFNVERFTVYVGEERWLIRVTYRNRLLALLPLWVLGEEDAHRIVGDLALGAARGLYL